MSGGLRPPVSGLIPFGALSGRSTRPRRRLVSIDSEAVSRGLENLAATPNRRRHRRRAVNKHIVRKQSRSSSPTLDRAPRVNPIFVWVRQEDTRIVDVKCEDYDKRNRILLTKTAHGWRAIPRTEMHVDPRASAESSTTTSTITHSHHHRHHHRRRSRKSKSQQTTAMPFSDSDACSEPAWVTPENVNIESLLPSHTIHVKRSEISDVLSGDVNKGADIEFARETSVCSTPVQICDVSPLENLLAVAELELKHQMESDQWHSETQAQHENKSEIEEAENPLIKEISNLLKTESRDLDIDERNQSPECNYQEEDDISMNDILSRLEQSLESPTGDFCPDSLTDHEISAQIENNETIAIDLNQNNTSQLENYISNSDTTDICDSEMNTDQDALISEEDSAIKILVEMKNSDAKQLENNGQAEYDHEDITQNESLNFTDDLNQSKDQENDADMDCHQEEQYDNDEFLDGTEKNENDDNPNESFDNNENTENLEDKGVEYETMPESTTLKYENNIDEIESSNISEDHIETIDKLDEDESAVCLDLSIKKTQDIDNNIITKDEPLQIDIDDCPTDLTVRKERLSPNKVNTNMDYQISETSQSPKPSGIPAVPTSPDVVSTSSTFHSVFLEAHTNQSNLSVSKDSEPLDLGNSRKSASPTVTCSEEITAASFDSQPPSKKLKHGEIDLKHLLAKSIGLMENKKTTKELQEISKLSSLFEISNDTLDPVIDYKQLLKEIDVPNPLMVPKDYFPDLLKNPRREILRILTSQSDKNISPDDILVVYKDKLLAAIETSRSKNMLKNDNNENSTYSHKSLLSKHNEKTSNTITKSMNFSGNRSNTLHDEIEAANEAASLWMRCSNNQDMMANYSNHNDLIQSLYDSSSLPYNVGPFGDLYSGLHLLLGNKESSSLGYPLPLHLNMNNPFEQCFWPESMMHSGMMRNRVPFETTFSNHPNYKSNVDNKRDHNKINSKRMHSEKSRISVNQPLSHLQKTYVQSLGTDGFLQNPYLALSGFRPGNNNPNLHVSQNLYQKKKPSFPTADSQKSLSKHNRATSSITQSGDQEKRKQKISRQQLFQHTHQRDIQKVSSMKKTEIASSNDSSKNYNHNLPTLKSGQVQCPIDLSRSQNQFNKKQTDEMKDYKCSSSSSLKGPSDDIPEVGSTTGNVEDITDTQTHLWHPLFGNLNKSCLPWNLTSLATSGE